jgi:hypothetical protein
VTVTSLTLHDVVWARMENLSVDTYDGEFPATPPLDPDGRIAAYAVLYASAGRLHSTTLDGGQRSLLGSFQVSCFGGSDGRALGCVDTIRAAVVGTVTVDGATRVIRARDEDPGPILTDPNYLPPRHYVPLEFELFAP